MLRKSHLAKEVAEAEANDNEEFELFIIANLNFGWSGKKCVILEFIQKSANSVALIDSSCIIRLRWKKLLDSEQVTLNL